MKSGRRYTPLLWLGLIPVFALVYSRLNTPVSVVHHLSTSLDGSIPFIKWFIFPYMGWYFFIPGVLIYLCLQDRKLYYKTLLSTFLSIGLCYATYLGFQTTVPRPHLVEGDWVTDMVKFLYRVDEPYNCFPSIHCLTSALMVRAVYSSVRKRVALPLVSIVALLIILSTMFLKQHVIMDVASGVLLGYAVFYLISRLEEVSRKPWMKPFYSWTMKWTFWNSSRYTSEMKDIRS